MHGYITVHVATSVIFSYLSTRDIQIPLLFPQQFTIGFTVIIETYFLISRYKRQELNVIPTTEDKKVMIRIVDSSVGFTDV